MSNPSYVFCYAGKYYGYKHLVLSVTGGMWTLLHEATGYQVTVHRCDVEMIKEGA